MPSASRLPPKLVGDAPRAFGGLSRLAAMHLSRAGIDPEPLLRKMGLPPTLMNNPDVRVSARRQIIFINVAADILKDELLGFHLALEFDVRELGPFYYVMASSETLGEALVRDTRYSSIVNEGLRLTLRRETGLTVDFEYLGVARHIDQQAMEFWVTSHLRKCRQVTDRELVPTHTSFIHRHDGDISEMHRYFGRKPMFGTSEDRVSLEAQAAQLPLIARDPYLNKCLVQLCETAIVRHRRRHRLRSQVENAMTPRLPHGNVRIEVIARDLGMSARTLSRRLAEQGESFRHILDELRSDLAARYLEDRSLSISEIGWLLGYAEASTFVRAVRRWKGKPPSEVRRQITEISNDETQDSGRP